MLSYDSKRKCDWLKDMKQYTDQHIIKSWKKNVQPWVAAVREGEIEDRLLFTNQAIINAISSKTPKTVLDIGCGEGWLVRELVNAGIHSFGIDAIPGFIEYAQSAGGGNFKAISYEEISSHTFKEKFDVAVCNFSLLGHECVNHVFKQVATLLTRNGFYIIQTIHPVMACGESTYEDGWRAGSWRGFSNQFSDPAPWYFRTLESWKLLFIQNNFKLHEILEPLHPATHKPASIIFIGQLDS